MHLANSHPLRVNPISSIPENVINFLVYAVQI
jgi:hypothetical protein